MSRDGSGSVLLDALLASGRRDDRITHIETLPARAGTLAQWPAPTHPDLITALAARGIDAPWQHQTEFADHAFAGSHTAIATGTASGKTLAFWLPSLSALLTPPTTTRRPTVLYLAPTKALAADQFRALNALGLEGLRPALYDGDTPTDERVWARSHANYLMTNPDMLHHGILPGHNRWNSFLRGLTYVVIDECHAYRGVFGAHVALVLRRLRRICAQAGSSPVFLMASATVADPGATGERLIGAPVVEVTNNHAPRAHTTFALWQPPLLPGRAPDPVELVDPDAAVPDLEPVRRTAPSETADVLTDLVIQKARTLAFVRSRRGVESVARMTRDHLNDIDSSLVDRVAAYRGGYLAEERRELEAQLRSGEILGLATTNALELGVDVSGLDAVVMAGWPGTRASLWQQAGRAGRDGGDALAVFIARDDPLDAYVVHHPEAVFGRPTEASVFDPDNPYVLAPHLCAAASEIPLTDEGDSSIDAFGPRARDVADALVAQGHLRRRSNGWFWTSRDRASNLADLRGSGGAPVRIVEGSTGRMLGTVDAASSHANVHPGAVYVHQGAQYLVRTLDEEDSVASVEPIVADYSTHARSVTQVNILETSETTAWGVGAELSLGFVEVTTQVIAFARRRLGTGELLGEEPLDLPERTLRTASVWWTLSAETVEASGIEPRGLPGAAHAAEHASIGLLPLLATCDRWDLGGLSTAMHPDTGRLTVFVHDAVQGGAGFAERGYLRAPQWLRATREAIATCPCADGCPACVQSPKCGNGNDPLSKAGAVQLLDTLLADAPPLHPS